MASEAADDYNDDGEIDEEDFKLFVDRLFEGGPDGPGDGPFVPAFEDWLASEAADDYNDDGEIDEEDFKLFVDRLFEGLRSRRSWWSFSWRRSFRSCV